MDIDQKFYVWCARNTLDQWYPPEEVLVWLDDPENIEKAKAAGTAAANDKFAWSKAAWIVRIATTELTDTDYMTEVAYISLPTIEIQINFPQSLQEFVATLSDEELKTTDPKWIQYATIEIFSRQND